jgi:hypothetical protein
LGNGLCEPLSSLFVGNVGRSADCNGTIMPVMSSDANLRLGWSLIFMAVFALTLDRAMRASVNSLAC